MGRYQKRGRSAHAILCNVTATSGVHPQGTDLFGVLGQQVLFLRVTYGSLGQMESWAKQPLCNAEICVPVLSCIQAACTSLRQTLQFQTGKTRLLSKR